MALTGSAVAITQAVVDLLKANETSLGLKDTFYGDTEVIMRVPAVSVLSTEKAREYYQTGMQTQVAFQTEILVFASNFTDRQTTQKEADLLYEAIEALLHTDHSLGGLVVSSLVVSMEPGFAQRGKQVFISNRLTLEANSREHV